MKLLFSIPTGYHLRELILPLKSLLEDQVDMTSITCLTPAAPFAQTIFPAFSPKFRFVENPQDAAGHLALMKELQPNLVITNTVGHDERDYPILVAAKEAGLRSLTFIASWDNVWKIERLLKAPNRVALADHFIVWNEMMMKHMKNIFRSLPHTSISVIGAPRLDFFFHADRIPSKEQLYRTLGFTDTSRPLLHLSTTELYPMAYVGKTIRQAINTGDIPNNPHVLATVHPGGNLDNHKSLEQYGVKVRFAFGRRDESPHPAFRFNPTMDEIYASIALFKHTAVLVNHSSTTAIESFVADVPVVNVKYGRPLDWWRWYRSMVYRDFKQHYADITSGGATTLVTSPKQLVTAIATYIKDPTLHHDQRAATLKKMITTVDGTTSQKVLSVIKQQATL